MQKLIYIEEKEGEEKVRKKNQTQKLLINLVLWLCCICRGLSFSLVQYPKLSFTVL